MLLSQAWETYESDKRIEGFSPQTLKAYKLQSILLIRFFNDVQIDKITTEQLKAYLAKSSESLKHLREACCSPMENALFEFMFSTGCQIGEVVTLDRGRINWMNRSAIIRGKGDKEREVYFNIRCEIWLKRYLDNREDRDTAIFVTERDPHRMSIAQMRYIIKRISNRASINKGIHPHQLRHSYATHLLNNGAPLDVIQSLLGHEKSETTRIYAQLSGSIRQQLYMKYF
ncbi:tyrosine-type recombinase/integrase [Neobacillus sp. C211]|uniref:tyrosine-type recombinase/integrase n=1 Tax=unclassified Neobacillus TaxID=2675272 RepID=UPI00397A169B